MSEEVEHPTREEIEESRFITAMKRHREDRGWSQGKLAREMNGMGWESFHQTTIRRIEDGERAVRLGEARALARIFGTTVGQMTAPNDIERMMSSFAEDLQNLENAERDLAGNINNLVGKTQSLEYSLTQIKDIDPDSWRDKGLADQFQFLVSKARSKVDRGVIGLIHGVLSDFYPTPDDDEDN